MTFGRTLPWILGVHHWRLCEVTLRNWCTNPKIRSEKFSTRVASRDHRNMLPNACQTFHDLSSVKCESCFSENRSTILRSHCSFFELICHGFSEFVCHRLCCVDHGGHESGRRTFSVLRANRWSSGGVSVIRSVAGLPTGRVESGVVWDRVWRSNKDGRV